VPEMLNCALSCNLLTSNNVAAAELKVQRAVMSTELCVTRVFACCWFCVLNLLTYTNEQDAKCLFIRSAERQSGVSQPFKKNYISAGRVPQHSEVCNKAKRPKPQLLIYPSEHSLSQGRSMIIPSRWQAKGCKFAKLRTHILRMFAYQGLVILTLHLDLTCM
jgi:hypothetical protein